MKKISLSIFILFVQLFLYTPAHADLQCNKQVKTKVANKNIIICSNGGDFLQKGNTWQGSSIEIYQASSGGNKLIRNFEVFGIGGVKLKKSGKYIQVIVEMEQYPKWKHKPVFTEHIDFATGKSTIKPHFKVPVYNKEKISTLIAKINKNKNEILGKAGTGNDKALEVIYTNLFGLYRLGYNNPGEMLTRLKPLSGKGWNDGEVAMVYYTITAHLTYLKDKKILLK